MEIPACLTTTRSRKACTATKYRPEFTDRTGFLEDARVQCQGSFHWYNLQHHRGGIAMLTPRTLHYAVAADVLDNGQRVLTATFQ
jgi:hypothetical protein